MTDQELLAHHEAAHAVVAISLGWEINQVTIVADDDTFGHCQVKDFELYFDGNRWTGEVKASARQAILYDLAGIAAEMRINGDYDEVGCSSDWGKAYTKARHLTRACNPQTYLDYALGRTKKLVNSHWQRVTAVAAGLLEHQTLTGEDVYTLAGMKP